MTMPQFPKAPGTQAELLDDIDGESREGGMG